MPIEPCRRVSWLKTIGLVGRQSWSPERRGIRAPRTSDYRNIPMYGNRDREGSVSVVTRGVDMWWRRGSKQLIVTSEMDGTVIANVITQDYGTSLWVAILLEREERDNWAKSMAWAAFRGTLDRVVRYAIIEVAGDNAIIDVADPRKSDA